MWDDRALLPVYYYPRGTVESGRDNTLDSFARKNRVEVFTRTENKDKFPDINKTNQSWKVFGHHKVSLLLCQLMSARDIADRIRWSLYKLMFLETFSTAD